MSDRRRTDTDRGGEKLDFSGLLPGDDQPRRRRGRPRSREANPEDSGRGPDGSPGDGREERTSQEAPPSPPEEGGGGDTDAPSRVPDTGTRSTAPADSTGESSDEGPGPFRHRQAEGSTARSRRATDTGASRSDAPVPGHPITDAGDGLEIDRGASSGGSAVRRADPEAQAALVEGEDLDRVLRRVAALTPEERGEYKSTLLLSEEHYELLMDLRKEFRRRGFKGRDATISNVISVGLEIMRHTLDAEKSLPGR